MNIIIGHSNMDLDCMGSIVLARYLHPDCTPVKSRLIHPVARNLYNMYQYHLNFMSSDDLKGEDVEKIVMVDTRSYGRVKEYFENMNDFNGEIEIYDHHPSDVFDFEGAVVHEFQYGSNTTILGKLLIEKGIVVSPEDATIALAGIYADTGNFTHEDVCEADFSVAGYLMNCGASINLVKNFLKSLKEEHQVSLFHEILEKRVFKDFHGHLVIISHIEMEKQVGGLAAVVEKVFDVEDSDAIFIVFSFNKEKKVLIVARSNVDSIDVNELMQPFGGGGHPQASSANMKKKDGAEAFHELEELLAGKLTPAVTAGDIMTQNVQCIHEDSTLLDASIFFENINHTGGPVVNSEGELTGILTLRDIMKGRKANQMHVPVRAFMRRNIITASTKSTLREIENLMFDKNIGHLPILDETRLAGIVTRSDYLMYMEKRNSHQNDEKDGA